MVDGNKRKLPSFRSFQWRNEIKWILVRTGYNNHYCNVGNQLWERLIETTCNCSFFAQHKGSQEGIQKAEIFLFFRSKRSHKSNRTDSFFSNICRLWQKKKITLKNYQKKKNHTEKKICSILTSTHSSSTSFKKKNKKKKLSPHHTGLLIFNINWPQSILTQKYFVFFFFV